MKISGFLDVLRALAGHALRGLARLLLWPSKVAFVAADAIDPRPADTPPGPEWREPPAAPPPEWDRRRSERSEVHSHDPFNPA